MKKVIIACGSGVATSTLIASKVGEVLEKHGIQARVVQCSVNEVDGHVDGADLVVTSVGRLEVKGDVPIVLGLSYLTGMGTEATDAEIARILLEK